MPAMKGNDTTPTYNNTVQHTAVLRILRRTARSAAEIVERTAAQHTAPYISQP